MKLESSVTLFDDNKVEDRFAELQITADGITAEVGRKVGNDEVISRINQSAEAVTINANKINIAGTITAINNNSTTTINGGKITTGTLSARAVKADSGQFDTANIPDLNANKITSGDILANRMSANLVSAFQAVVSDLKALAATIGGFFIGDTDIHTKDVPITSNADNSVGLSSSVFTRTINGTSRSNLKFAIGSKFGVDKSGTLYANGANVTSISADNISTGTINTSRLNANEIKSQIVQTTELNADKIMSGTIKASLINAIGANSGAHAALTSNGLDIYGSDGATTLASFGASGARVGKQDAQNIQITQSAINVYDVDGSNPFSVTTEGSQKTRTLTKFSYLTASGTSASSTTTQIILEGKLTDGKIYIGISASGKPTTFSSSITVSNTTQTITVSGVQVSARFLRDDVIQVSLTNNNSGTRYWGIRYTERYRESLIKINDANLKPENHNVAITASDGSVGLAYVYTYGHIAMLLIEVYKSNVDVGGTIFQGTMLDYTPITPTALSGRYSTRNAIIGSISATGNIVVQNTGSQTISPTSSSPLTLFATYIYK